MDFTGARDDGWQWHQLDHMQIFAPRCKQITMPAPHHSVFTGWMPFLPPIHQRQSTESLQRCIWIPDIRKAQIMMCYLKNAQLYVCYGSHVSKLLGTYFVLQMFVSMPSYR